MLRTVQRPMEEVVVFRSVLGLLSGREHLGCVTTGALPLVRLCSDHLAHQGPAALGEVPALVEHQLLRGNQQEHLVSGMLVQMVKSAVDLVELLLDEDKDGVPLVRRAFTTLDGVADDRVAPGVERRREVAGIAQGELPVGPRLALVAP